MADYFVDGEDILENKLGIHDREALKAAEQEIVTNKTADILNETAEDFGLDYLIHIHKVLFEGIYDFAGKIRTVDISKPDAASPFAYVQFIDTESNRIFDDLKKKNYLNELDQKNFIEEVTKLAVELNALHPFRDGNGRAIRLYLIMLTDHAGYLLDYSQVSATELIDADIRAFEGDVEKLLQVYRKTVSR